MIESGAAALFDRTLRDLEQWRPSRSRQEHLRSDYLELLRSAGPAALQRDGGAEHLTASCFVVTSDFRQVLLAFHRKAQRWLQLGGHLEPGDGSCAAAAIREAHEEGGIAGLRLAGDFPADLDRHRLVGTFGSCLVHWDVGYLAIADEPVTPRVSDESEAVAWWTIQELRAADPQLSARLDLMLEGAGQVRNWQ
jgi:8-oxo-dGTP pyrophosphatase MutT (NUDIX family)